MKTQKIKLLMLLIFSILFLQENCLSQISTDLVKYWYYRNRLNNYFVVPGEKHGESQIVCVRNRIYNWPETSNPNDTAKANVDFGQHGKYTGLYWGVLATEYYLLHENGQYADAAITENELYLALKAYKVYWDEKAEPYWNKPENFDGFFIRGSVPCDFLDTADTWASGNGFNVSGVSHLSLLNKGLDTNDVWNSTTSAFGSFQQGHPGYVDHRTSTACDGIMNSNPDIPTEFDGYPEDMSKDEAIGLMLGLALTAKYTQGTASHALADSISHKIVTYLLQSGKLLDPDGSPVYSGTKKDRPWVFGSGIKAAGAAMTGNFYGLPSLTQKIMWKLFWWDSFSVDNRGMVATLAALGNSWRYYGIINKTAAGICNNTAKFNWDSFYLLLWEDLNNKNRCQNKQEQLLTKALGQLNTGPCEGPYNYGNNHYASNGWAACYRWYKDNGDQTGADFYTGNYNGTDYMLLYNLYHIQTKGDAPFYVNYNDKNLVGTVNSKINFVGFNSISSTQIINAAADTVNYTAGDHIHLMPGFHATAGSDFHAYISNIDCSGSVYPDNMYTNYYDSLISQAKSPYVCTVEDDTTADNTLTLPCPNDTISFSDTLDEAYTYYWDFGNGETSTSPSPKVFYNIPGNYTITLIATDTNGIADTTSISVVAPDCKLYGYLYESASCGGAPINGDSLYITWNNNHVVTVDPAVSGQDGYFLFNSSQILQLDTTKSYTITTYSGISIDGMAAHPISYWIANSPLNLHYATSIHQEWVARYNGPDSLADNAFALDLQGNIYVTGSTRDDLTENDMLTIKYNPAGTQRWAVTHAGSGNGSDYSRAIVVDSYQNVYIAGESNVSGNSYITTISYDSAGTFRWLQTYQPACGSLRPTAVSILQDHAGDIIVGATTVCNDQSSYYTVLKYGTAGNSIWTANYSHSAPQYDILKALSIDANDNIYATGYSQGGASNYDMATVKFNSSGVQQWADRYNNSNADDYGYSNTVDNDGNIIVTGYSHFGNGSDGIVVRKYNPSSSTPVWTRTYSTDTHDYAGKILCNDANDIYIAGYYNNGGNPGLLALKYNTSGTLQWFKNSLSNNSFIAKSATLDNADNLYITGTTSGTDITTQKLNSASDIQWTETYNGPASGNDVPTQVMVSDNGNVYVCGNSTGSSTNYDFTTIKYSQCESTSDLLKITNDNGTSNITNTVKENSSVQVVPNPNNGNMTVNYEVPKGQTGLFTLYDITGRQLMNFVMFSGKNSFAINGSNLNKGIYFYKAIAGNKLIGTDKIVVIK